MLDFKQFKPTSWSIDNKTSIYIVTIIITLFGISSYLSLPKENFPDIVIPTINVSTVYPGTSPTDIEDLVTRKLEKKIKGINGVKKVTSNSIQDFSNVVVEFNANVKVEVAKQRVKDAVDQARSDLPNDLPTDPSVSDINFSDFPIMFVNIAGEYDMDKLKKFADLAKDRIEGMREITRVDMVGALEREVQIDVDMYKMQAAEITMYDIDNAIDAENRTLSGGLVKVGEMKRSVRVDGKYTDPTKIKDIIVKSPNGAPVYLRDIATVVYGFKERESYARLNHRNVITLNIVKRSGENLLTASDGVRAIVDDLKEHKYPSDLEVVVTGDQSNQTRVTLHDLINTIIIGFILVTIVLMFFMGTTNALFVGLSVPLSMFIAFILMPSIGFSMNMIVLFAFLFALGIVVDDAIVVIENTHRIYHDEHIPITEAAKKAAGEVFVPVFAGTLTTLAPFIPLAFLPGIVGKFMFYLPITLIITLVASLIVAFIINPVFAVSFMRKEKEYSPTASFFEKNKGLIISSVVMFALALICYLSGGVGGFGFGNFFIFMIILIWLNKFVFTRMINAFQNGFWPKFMRGYEKLLHWALHRPWQMLTGTVVLLVVSVIFFGASNPKVVFFPGADPNFIYVYIQLPVGTDQVVTDSVTRKVEDRVFKVVGENNPIVESIISNVTIGVKDPSEQDQSPQPHRGKVAVSFVEFGHRKGESTAAYLDKIRESVKGIPGAIVTVDQEQNGPPTGKPINIEISGDEFDDLVHISNDFIKYINEQDIYGIEGLKSDLEDKKPEILIEVDRERANREGLSTAQIGMEIRSAIFGREVGAKFKDGEDDNKIMIRYQADQRNKIDELLNLNITFRDMGMGGRVRQVPLSSVAKIRYANTYGGIKRINQKRVVTVASNVLSDGNANEIIAKIQKAIPAFKVKEGYDIKITGEQEDQKETSDYLGFSMMMSLGMIFLILVTQFNSVSKPIIILSEIVFSIIGVLLGYTIFHMEFVILMTGIGIVGLAGIVVKNGIIIVEFADELRSRGLELYPALVDAGKIRLAPVLLTATATILGLTPLAVGLNIDFVKMFTELNPHIFFGGDSVAFWGPLSWTIIFGLSFATFLTLVLVPCMYLISERIKLKMKGEDVQHIYDFDEKHDPEHFKHTPHL